MIDRSDLCEFLRYLTVAQSNDRVDGRLVIMGIGQSSTIEETGHSAPCRPKLQLKFNALWQWQPLSCLNGRDVLGVTDSTGMCDSTPKLQTRRQVRATYDLRTIPYATLAVSYPVIRHSQEDGVQ